MTRNPDKYSRSRILDPVKLNKGRSRWNQFATALNAIGPGLLQGPMLDLGCGAGYFVLEGLRRGMVIRGVDISAGKLLRFRKLVQLTGSPEDWIRHCIQADAECLPFAANCFSAVSSWYLLEHQRNPGVSLRELVRVTRPGGALAIKAQDARRGWEGHCKIPWIPFLSGRMARAWTEEFGAAIERMSDVVEVVQPQIIAILENLGCEVMVRADPPVPSIPRHWEIGTEADVRRTARRVKAMLAEGCWRPPKENLYVYAVKR